MEQRTGPSIQTVPGVATDPASVPGLTGPVPDGPEEKPAAPEAAVVETADGTPAAERAAVDAVVADADPEDAVPGRAPGDAASGADVVQDTPPGGPAFEAADRRARIVADAAGVRLSLDEENCEFRWDEIGAVEIASPRFGKRLRVVVHTPDRRWYPIEIEAPARGRVQEWESGLDAVLDAYFDENA
ncbi:hypothetical protein ACIRTB_27795 [Streptomyces sp. NPDC101158]|uniref:hypothetical protein n=1 Tax=Streptomyces sp. NPDC101158 TaxID=3366117 RepID=UPI0037F7BD04